MAILRTSSSVHSGKNVGVAEERGTLSLTDDLVAEIILKLPVKSVARSQCVAKTWHAAISDDYLRRRLPPQLSVVYFPDDPSTAAHGNNQGPRFASGGGEGGLLEDCDLSFLPFKQDDAGAAAAVVCDACNGLLLLRAAARFVVADPVTRRWAALPPPPSDDAMLSVLAFDPSTSGARHGYHVVNFTGWRDRGARLEVFSSAAGAWARRDADFGDVGADDLLCGSVHVHGGAVYILAAGTDRAVRMDLAAGDDDELVACTVVRLPEPVDGDGRVAHSGGRLHYVASDGELLKVWVQLDDEGQSSWRLKHAVKIDDVVEGACGGGEVRFLALHPEKDAVYLWSPWKLVEYDLVRNEVTGAWQFGGKDHNNVQKNRVVKTCLVPSSFYLSDCLADRRVQS
ncbi:hypothetical protein QOZ80_8BG0666780 [Eleusine coracana subsp. coracana]|nr:hypothetical protein QOZ80_8BG0666780 [Eleusine coracana subsp. coracana]